MELDEILRLLPGPYVIYCEDRDEQIILGSEPRIGIFGHLKDGERHLMLEHSGVERFVISTPEYTHRDTLAFIESITDVRRFQAKDVPFNGGGRVPLPRPAATDHQFAHTIKTRPEDIRATAINLAIDFAKVKSGAAPNRKDITDVAALFLKFIEGG